MSAKWVVLDMMGVILEVGDDVNDLLVPCLRKRNEAILAEGIDEMDVEASVGEIPSSDSWAECGFGSK